MNTKNFKIITLGILCFSVGVSSGNFAMSDVPANYKVAIVDVPKVVNSSKQVNTLKEEQKKKMSELSNYIKTAQKEIDKEQDENKKKQLEDKYSKELANKKQAIEKDYTTKLISIDKQIAEIIKEKAKAGNYNLVLSKGVVLSGGEDITNTISSEIK